MFPPIEGIPSLVESRIRQILGDLAHSATGDNFYFQALADNFIGTRRPAEQASWFLSAFGWSAVTFSEVDMEGTYVIGEPAIMQPRLVSLQAADGEETSSANEISTRVEASSSRIDLRLRREIGRLGRFLRQNDEKKHEGADDAVAVVGSTVGDEADRSEPNRQVPSQPVSGPATAPNGDASEASTTSRGSILQGLRLRLDKFRKPAQEIKSEDTQDLDQGPALPRLLFAYTPEPTALYDVDGRPRLPSELIPLCTLTFEDQIRGGAHIHQFRGQD